MLDTGLICALPVIPILKKPQRTRGFPRVSFVAGAGFEPKSLNPSQWNHRLRRPESCRQAGISRSGSRVRDVSCDLRCHPALWRVSVYGSQDEVDREQPSGRFKLVVFGPCSTHTGSVARLLFKDRLTSSTDTESRVAHLFTVAYDSCKLCL
jgi:hypothetical protein